MTTTVNGTVTGIATEIGTGTGVDMDEGTEEIDVSKTNDELRLTKGYLLVLVQTEGNLYQPVLLH